jgi:hypothetical protein
MPRHRAAVPHTAVDKDTAVVDKHTAVVAITSNL